jgi:hypothetical protein
LSIHAAGRLSISSLSFANARLAAWASIGNASEVFMPLAIDSTLPASKSDSRKAPTLTSAFGSAYSIAEINAYIAVRDQLLSEAEERPTNAKLASTALANDFLEGCLKPARSPYEAQCLSEADATRERKRCEVVRRRIGQLRGNGA